MTTGKLNKILEALDGISYLDWVKLEREVNQRFNADIRLMSNTTPLMVILISIRRTYPR